MKNLLLALLCLPLLILAQTTYVPDDNFEANGMGNGIPNDDYVTTSSIDTAGGLYVSNQNISDLTGIEDFISIANLQCNNNQLTTLDLSNNTNLDTLVCVNNQLTILDLRNGNNPALTYFHTTNNPNLFCIDVDDANWSTANWTSIDTQHYFSNNCSGTSIQNRFGLLVV